MSALSPNWVLAFLVVLAAGAGFYLLTPATGTGPVNIDANSVAIEGYDTVAYFTLDEPLRGKPEFEHTWQGARWRFANSEHRDLFAREPDRYAPRYGGYCAGGMALGRKVRVDPEAWVIVGGQLYLSYSKRDRDEFIEDPAPKIAQGNRNWAEIRND